ESGGTMAEIGSPGARCTRANTSRETPKATGTKYNRRLKAYRNMAAASSPLLHGDGREILEPALGLHEAGDLGAHCPPVQIVRDIDPVGLVDDVAVHVGQRLGLGGAVEAAVRLVDQLVELGILQDAPVGALGRHEVAVIEPHEGRVGIDRGAADVDGVGAGLL